MSDKKTPVNIKQAALSALQSTARYRLVGFVVFVAALYGYSVYTINSLSSQEPSDTTISNEVSSIRVPKLDKNVVKQLQDLRDNSVSVQTLFEDARNNPFNE